MEGAAGGQASAARARRQTARRFRETTGDEFRERVCAARWVGLPEPAPGTAAAHHAARAATWADRKSNCQSAPRAPAPSSAGGAVRSATTTCSGSWARCCSAASPGAARRRRSRSTSRSASRSKTSPPPLPAQARGGDRRGDARPVGRDSRCARLTRPPVPASTRPPMRTLEAPTLGDTPGAREHIRGTAVRTPLLRLHAPEAKLDAIARLGGEVVRLPFERWWRAAHQSAIAEGAGASAGTGPSPASSRASTSTRRSSPPS